MAAVFVYIVGNAEKNIFKLGIAADPFECLTNVQAGNPYRLSIVSKICVESKNAAVLVEGLGRKRMKEYAEADGWFVGLPNEIYKQFEGDHFLGAIAAQAGVKIVDRNKQAAYSKGKYLQRLSDIALEQGLTFENVLEKVEQAYDEGASIDKVMRF